MRVALKHPYAGKNCALTSMHAKASAIAPPLAEAVGLSIRPVTDIDTDALGTFSGEIPRPGTMLETAVAKARLGMKQLGLPHGIASEGSFGPHPLIPFLAASTELIVLVDDDAGLVIQETLLSERTNFAALAVKPGDSALDRFLRDAGFPEHALIVRPNLGEGEIRKGITDRHALNEAISTAASQSRDRLARVETDMRAHLNPTRMAEISRLASQFAERVARLCPACGAPGFGVVRTEAGLPCGDCGAPTGLVKKIVSGCVRCDHQTAAERPDGLAAASPAQCPECNP